MKTNKKNGIDDLLVKLDNNLKDVDSRLDKLQEERFSIMNAMSFAINNKQSDIPENLLRTTYVNFCNNKVSDTTEIVSLLKKLFFRKTDSVEIVTMYMSGDYTSYCFILNVNDNRIHLSVPGYDEIVITSYNSKTAGRYVVSSRNEYDQITPVLISFSANEIKSKIGKFIEKTKKEIKISKGMIKDFRCRTKLSEEDLSDDSIKEYIIGCNGSIELASRIAKNTFKIKK